MFTVWPLIEEVSRLLLQENQCSSESHFDFFCVSFKPFSVCFSSHLPHLSFPPALAMIENLNIRFVASILSPHKVPGIVYRLRDSSCSPVGKAHQPLTDRQMVYRWSHMDEKRQS